MLNVTKEYVKGSEAVTILVFGKPMVHRGAHLDELPTSCKTFMVAGLVQWRHVLPPNKVNNIFEVLRVIFELFFNFPQTFRKVQDSKIAKYSAR